MSLGGLFTRDRSAEALLALPLPFAIAGLPFTRCRAGHGSFLATLRSCLGKAGCRHGLRLGLTARHFLTGLVARSRAGSAAVDRLQPFGSRLPRRSGLGGLLHLLQLTAADLTPRLAEIGGEVFEFLLRLLASTEFAEIFGQFLELARGGLGLGVEEFAGGIAETLPDRPRFVGLDGGTIDALERAGEPLLDLGSERFAGEQVFDYEGLGGGALGGFVGDEKGEVRSIRVPPHLREHLGRGPLVGNEA